MTQIHRVLIARSSGREGGSKASLERCCRRCIPNVKELSVCSVEVGAMETYVVHQAIVLIICCSKIRTHIGLRFCQYVGAQDRKMAGVHSPS